MDLVGIVATVVMAGLVVGLSYLARRARGSRSLEAVLQAIMVLGGLLQVLSAVLALALSVYLSAGLSVAGVLWGVLAFRRPSTYLLRPLPVDPEVPMHRLAVALALGLMAVNLSVAFSWSRLVAQIDVGDIRGLGSLWLLLVNDLGLLAVALAGVGWPEDRSFGEAMDRLGLKKLRGVGAGAALAVALGLLAFGAGIESIAGLLGMGSDRASEIAMRQMLELAGRSPLRIAVIAMATGFSEEVLFRGALQPRLGLVITALVFASFHVQYGVGIGFIEVLGAGLVLGVLRDRFGTLSSAVAHGVYNAEVLAILSFTPFGQG